MRHSDGIIPYPGMYASLSEIESDCWSRLQEGCDSARHPFHLPVIANAGIPGADLRTVVLRRVDAEVKILGFHTDVRSEKWKGLQQQTSVSWLFYSAADSIQLRFHTQAVLHYADTLAREVWDNSPLHCRRVYMGDERPGSPSDKPVHGLPDELLTRVPSAAESEKGWKHFGLVYCRVETMEWLKLSSKGHLRARFRYEDGVCAESTWLVP